MDLNKLISQDNFTSEQDVQDFLYDIPKFTAKHALSHTVELWRRLGEPCADVPKMHVAGTNGKGSVCAYLQGLLQAAGKRTGGFISPHLVSVRERFLIGGAWCSEAILLEAFCQVKAMADQAYVTEGISYPTFFEFLFLMGMVIFEKEGAEVLILETGLGGRLDATNIFDNGSVAVSIITEIGLDHTAYLGETREAIAAEKAGIIKSATPVVFLDNREGVSQVITQQAHVKKSPIFPVTRQDFSVKNVQRKGIDFYYQSRYHNNTRLFLSTTGLYQVENAALALRAFEVYGQLQLAKEGNTPLSVEAMREALAATHWEGRMEEIVPGIFFDGAHNLDGIEAFLASVRAQADHSCQAAYTATSADRVATNAAPQAERAPRILCFSVVEDKAYKDMICRLRDSHLFSHIILVEMEDSRGLAVDTLKEQFGDGDFTLFCEKGAKAGLDRVLTVRAQLRQQASGPAQTVDAPHAMSWDARPHATSSLDGDAQAEVLGTTDPSYIPAYIVGSLYLVGLMKAVLRRK